MELIITVLFRQDVDIPFAATAGVDLDILIRRDVTGQDVGVGTGEQHDVSLGVEAGAEGGEAVLLVFAAGFAESGKTAFFLLFEVVVALFPGVEGEVLLGVDHQVFAGGEVAADDIDLAAGGEFDLV